MPVQIATYTGEGLNGFPELVATRMHDAQQTVAFDPANSAASEEADQLVKALPAQPCDVRLEVLRRHPAVLSADNFVDPVFLVFN